MVFDVQAPPAHHSPLKLFALRLDSLERKVTSLAAQLDSVKLGPLVF